MSGFDRYFQSQQEPSKHPKVRHWERVIREKHARLVCEIIREREGLSFGPTRIYVLFLDQMGRSEVDRPDEVDWDARLNDELLRLKAKALNEKNEILRFGLVLRDRLEQPEDLVGDGFFNAVLLEFIDESPFAKEQEVQEKRQLITSYRASHDGRSFRDCWDAIEAIFIDCARDLIALGYKRYEAERILSRALAEYLDERFSLTNRQLLGFLRR